MKYFSVLFTGDLNSIRSINFETVSTALFAQMCQSIYRNGLIKLRMFVDRCFLGIEQFMLDSVDDHVHQRHVDESGGVFACFSCHSG